MNNTDKKDNKIFRRFLWGSAAAFLLGVVLSSIANGNSELIEEFIQTIGNTKTFWAMPLFLIFLLTTVVGYSYVIGNYKKAKALVEAGYDDKAYERAEEILTRASVVNNILAGTNYLMFGLSLFVTGITEDNVMEMIPIVVALGTIVVFIVASICEISMQNKLVGLDKKMNPEKKGNIFDKKFAKEWIASCDEAEKSLIYESAYTAYRVAIRLSTGLWGISLIGMMTFHTGVLAVVISSIMMITLVTTYSLTAYKLQYKK